MNFNVIKDFNLLEVAHWSKKHLAEGSIIISNMLFLQRLVKNASTLVPLMTVVQTASLKNNLFGFNTMIGNVKNQ